MYEISYRLGTMAPIIILSIVGLVRYPKGKPWMLYFIGLGLQVFSLFGQIAENNARLQSGMLPSNNITVSIVTLAIVAAFFALLIFNKTRNKDK